MNLNRRGFLLGSAAVVAAAAAPAPVLLDPVVSPLYCGEIGEWAGMRFLSYAVDEMKETCGISDAMLGAFMSSPARPRRAGEMLMIIPPAMIRDIQREIAGVEH